MGSYSVKVDPKLWVHYKDILQFEEGEFSVPQYTFFSFKNKNWVFNFYKTGKVLIQGKDINYPLHKFFNKKSEETIAASPSFMPLEAQGELALYPHIGTDESGKGDFFGPLCVAGCYLTEENALKLKRMGAMDSKKLDDKKILELSELITANSVYEIVVIGNKKYNELYSKFKNLNKLLAWGHSTVIENLITKTSAKIAVLDKFANEKVILYYLKTKGKQVNLIQQTKAESDTAVACASILARARYVKLMSDMSYKYEMDFPKGASTLVLKTGKEFIKKYGIEELNNVSKTHFKTYEDVQKL